MPERGDPALLFPDDSAQSGSSACTNVRLARRFALPCAARMTGRSPQPETLNAWCRAEDQGVRLRVLVTPRASRSKIVGLHADALKVNLAAPPVEGAANAELCSILAKTLGVPKRSIEIVQGEQARHKTVLIRGITLDRARALAGEAE